MAEEDYTKNTDEPGQEESRANEQIYLSEPETREYLDKKWVLSRLILQIAGKPKEHIEKTLNALIDDIKKYEQIKLVKSVTEPPEKDEQDIWTTYAELEIVTKNLEVLTEFCMEYMPSSVEILEPENALASASAVTNFLNDFMAKLHDVSMRLKNVNAKNEILNKNAGALLSNLIFLILKNESKSIEEISKQVGVKTDQLKSILDNLVQQGKITEQDGKYSLNK